jgi:hypothetical protein
LQSFDHINDFLSEILLAQFRGITLHSLLPSRFHHIYRACVSVTEDVTVIGKGKCIRSNCLEQNSGGVFLPVLFSSQILFCVVRNGKCFDCIFYLLLCAFANCKELRHVCLAVRPSVRVEQLAPSERVFMKFNIRVLSENPSIKFKFH